FGGDQARARAEKRVIDHLTGPAVVGDWATHAFDRFLRAVPPALLTLLVSKRVVVGDLPNRRLPAVALPMTGLTFAHRIPTGFVLPVVVTAAQREVLLDPDDLSARHQPASSQIGGDDVAMESPMPDIGDIPGEELIRCSPFGANVVQYLTHR